MTKTGTQHVFSCKKSVLMCAKKNMKYVGSMCMLRLVLLYFTITGKKSYRYKTEKLSPDDRH